MKCLICQLLFITFFILPSYAAIHTYDSLNRLSKTEYGNGQIIEYQYDPGGNLLSVVNTLPEQDSDADGITDNEDNCPDIPNTDQTDSDEDSIGDACDNCPEIANTDQADENENTIGDVCEAANPCDLTGDGVADRNDLMLILSYRNKPASFCPECNVDDSDDVITVLDATKYKMNCLQ